MEPKKPISHLVAGLIIGAALVLFRVIIYISGVEETGTMAWLPIFILIAGLIVFINMYGNAMNNDVGFGNLFGYGFKTTAVLTLIVIACTALFIILIPEAKEKGFELAKQKMIEKGTLSDDEIEKALQFVRKMFWFFTIGGIMLVYAIVGAVGSAIGATITKKRPVNPANQLNF
jgi:Protein of unknown function (DUF4199)